MIYYYSDGDNKFGPYSYEELLKQPIHKDSLIWHEGLDKWVYAYEVDALKDFLQALPSHPENTFINADDNVRVKTIKIVIGRKFLFWTIFILILIAFVSKLAMEKSKKTEAETEIVVEKPVVQQPVLTPKQKEEIKQAQKILKEKESPVSFLTLDYKTSKAFLSKKHVISGKIMNSASETTYKNMVILVKFFDENKKQIESKEFPIDKKVKPNSDTKFKIKNRNPKGTESIELSIISSEIETPKS